MLIKVNIPKFGSEYREGIKNGNYYSIPQQITNNKFIKVDWDAIKNSELEQYNLHSKNPNVSIKKLDFDYLQFLYIDSLANQ